MPRGRPPRPSASIVSHISRDAQHDRIGDARGAWQCARGDRGYALRLRLCAQDLHGALDMLIHKPVRKRCLNEPICYGAHVGIVVQDHESIDLARGRGEPPTDLVATRSLFAIWIAMQPGRTVDDIATEPVSEEDAADIWHRVETSPRR